jgi:rhodanese-related sulfurtransferase
VAEKYQNEGFTNAKALRGGVDAWKKAGYGMVAH